MSKLMEFIEKSKELSKKQPKMEYSSDLLSKWNFNARVTGEGEIEVIQNSIKIITDIEGIKRFTQWILSIGKED